MRGDAEPGIPHLAGENSWEHGIQNKSGQSKVDLVDSKEPTASQRE